MIADPKRCPHCALQLAGRLHYREVDHCWVERRKQGANAARLAHYTGRAICGVCIIDLVGPSESEAAPRVTTCDRCQEHAPPLFLEVTHCWVTVRGGSAKGHAGANTITRARYSGLVLCRRCLFEAEKGDQLDLFGGA